MQPVLQHEQQRELGRREARSALARPHPAPQPGPPTPSPPPQPGPRAPTPLTCQRALSSLLSRLHCIWITWGRWGPKVTHEGSDSATEEQERMHLQGAQRERGLAGAGRTAHEGERGFARCREQLGRGGWASRGRGTGNKQGQAPLRAPRSLGGAGCWDVTSGCAVEGSQEEGRRGGGRGHPGREQRCPGQGSDHGDTHKGKARGSGTRVMDMEAGREPGGRRGRGGCGGHQDNHVRASASQGGGFRGAGAGEIQGQLLGHRQQEVGEGCL